MDNLEQVDDDELENIIERAREMEEHYGHYFDMIIIYRWNFLITVILLLVLQSCKRSVIWQVEEVKKTSGAYDGQHYCVCTPLHFSCELGHISIN